jgi:hypothetical protein
VLDGMAPKADVDASALAWLGLALNR